MPRQTFAQLVSLACHDLRTPLATASGFARTLQRLEEIKEPGKRYVEMIGAATDQLAELLDLLSAVARIEAGRFEPQLRSANTRELADAAAGRVDDGRIAVEGDGGEVRADVEWSAISVGSLAEAARRHGGLDQINLRADGATISIAPIADDVGPIAVGDNLKDFAAAVGTQVLRSSGVDIELDGDRLDLRFPG